MYKPCLVDTQNQVISLYLCCTMESWRYIILSKIVTDIIDSTVLCNFIKSLSVIRGNSYKLMQKHVDYDLTKFSSNNKIVSMWISLPDNIISASSFGVFEKRLRAVHKGRPQK